MKFINKFKSPNFDIRKNKQIKIIIIHYTALKNSKEALSYLCNPNKKVSSHFLISQKGEIFSLVDEAKRAWHAGISFWKNNTDINSNSIGIELDYSPNHKNNIFSKKMICSLLNLLRYLKNKYNLNQDNILAHSDVSPFRKKDPGLKFPWQKLYNKDLAFNPVQESNYDLNIIKSWFYKNNLKTDKSISIFILSYIGYDTRNILKESRLYSKLIKVYKLHFIQSETSSKLDKQTLSFLIKHFLSLVLTKN